MLIQHLLTERLFRTVFDTPTSPAATSSPTKSRSVIDALISHSLSRDVILSTAWTASTPPSSVRRRNDQRLFAEAALSSTLSYEQFFQGFSVKGRGYARHRLHPAADRRFHGEAASPPSLEREFGPFAGRRGGFTSSIRFVGTGNFIVRMMREIPRTALVAQVRVGAALQRGDAAALLHRQHEH